ncbi:MAG: FecR domain-containing protein, partial [Myxococcales bacterium]|nr:FecR domain-containing protein [Myxococcales bacterium]
MRSSRPVVALALLAIALGARAAWSAPKTGDTYKYTIVPGDTCWNIAEKLFGNGKKYKLIHQFNELGPMPHILTPGKTLLLPRSGNIPTARVEWMREDVKAKPPNAIDWLKAKKQMSLWKLYKVSTGDHSSAGIRFEDASFLMMRQRALLVIYGGSKTLSRTKRLEKGGIVVERGIVKGGLASLLGKAPLLIKTPSSELKVRSTTMQVEVTPTKKSIVSVHDGQVEVKAKGKTVNVPANHGTSVEIGKAPEKPRRLPPRPKWRSGVRRLVVFAPAGHTARFEAEWAAVKVAKRYHVELSRHPKFRSPMLDAVVGAGVLKMRAQDLKPATYYARISVIDRHRMESKPSAPLEVSVVALESSRQLRRDKQGVFETAGLLALRAPTSVAPKTEVSSNGKPFRPFSRPLRLSKPGLYQLRFRFRGTRGAESAIAVRILAIAGRFSGPVEPIHV